MKDAKTTLLAALLTGGILAAGPVAAADRIAKIGLVQSTTGGSAALYGVSQKNAAELAVDEINVSGKLGDIKLVTLHEDDGGDRGQTVNIYQKLISQEKVTAILGPSLSNSAFAADPIAQTAGVPVIASSNTAPGITDIGDYIFRTSPPDSIIFPGVLKYAREKYGIKKVAHIYGIDDQMTKAAYNIQKKALEDAGIEVLTTETFQKGDVDFSAQLTKIKAANPDAIVLASLAEETASIIRQARTQAGIPDKVQFLGQTSAISSKLFQLGGPAVEGLLVAAGWHADFPAPRNKTFVAAYEKKYGQRPDNFAAQAYDATYILADAIRKANSVTDRKAIRDAIAATADFDGAEGKLGFTANRDPVIEPKVLVARGGKFEPAQ